MGQPASSLSVYNSTLSGNVASAAGGALATANANATILNSTIAGNNAGALGGGIYGGSTAVKFTLGNDAIADHGHSLLSQPGTNSCSAITNGTNTDQVGTTANPINALLGV